MKSKSADPAKIGGVGGLPVCKLQKVNALESANPPTGECRWRHGMVACLRRSE